MDFSAVCAVLWNPARSHSLGFCCPILCSPGRGKGCLLSDQKRFTVVLLVSSTRSGIHSSSVAKRQSKSYGSFGMPSADVRYRYHTPVMQPTNVIILAMEDPHGPDRIP
ncbi:hypothetical protein Taro_021331 [Colocasia esculenta]|uniref:Uncharacterized protein n=1 Tax=Colocasia esculenta TaxID=4460 RepID=A0A843V7V7_COLES|nr:hypothetical protein [Colocasia esculenta]